MKHRTYVTNNNTGYKRRLFMTNGNLSLINSLTIINQFKLTKNCENHLIVWTEATSDFEKTMEEVAKLVPITNYYSFCNTTHDDVINFFLDNNLTDFDEIYILNGHGLSRRLVHIYPKAARYIIDEGICVQFPQILMEYPKVKKFIFARYLEKVDTIGETPGWGKNILPLDKEAFIKIGKQCEKLFPLDAEFTPTDKNIIFLGTFPSAKTKQFFTLEELMTYEKTLITKLLDHGYTVFFKPHPRTLFKHNYGKNFTILQTKLPLECYSLQDKCVAVVSLFSSASCQIYHYQGVPGFCATNLIKNAENDFGINLVKEYSPHVDILLSIDLTNKTVEEVRKEILVKYEEFLATKPLLSKNNVLLTVYKKNYDVQFIPRMYRKYRGMYRKTRDQLKHFRSTYLSHTPTSSRSIPNKPL